MARVPRRLQQCRTKPGRSRPGSGRSCPMSLSAAGVVDPRRRPTLGPFSCADFLTSFIFEVGQNCYCNLLDCTYFTIYT